MLPAPPPPPGARGLLCGSDERPLPTLIFSCIVVVSARAVESSQSPPPDFLPAGGYRRRWIFAAPRLSSSYCAPSATRRARGRRRRASRGSGSFFFTKSFYRGCSEGLHTPPTTVPHVVPRAQQQQPAAGIPVKGTVYPRALNVAGSRHPSPILSYVRRTGSCGHDTQGLSRMHVATTLNLPRA